MMADVYYQCPHCPYTSGSQGAMWQHLTGKHPEAPDNRGAYTPVHGTRPITEDSMTLSAEDKQWIIDQLGKGNSERQERAAVNVSVPDVMATAPPHPMHYGQIVVTDRGQNYDISCPECGRTQIGVSKPVLEKPVERTVEVVPEGFVKSPKTFEELQKWLDMPHENGKGLTDCPTCAPKFNAWLKSHGVRR